MTDFESVKIRKVVYNENGFQQGELLPEYSGTLKEAFDYYTRKWMKEHTDKNGALYDYIPESAVSSIDEFTVIEDDHFFIGLKSTYAYEGITENYTGYYGCELDKYGFEKMYDINGKLIPYSNE